MTKQRTWIPLLTGLVVAVTAIATSVPCLSWLDAGDFVTAASTLGIPHPTGFPLYTLIGHLMTYIPAGNCASRVAVFSGLCTGWCCFCLALVANRHTTSLLEILTVSFVLITLTVGAPIVFLSARVPEVYAVHMALIATSIFCVDSFLKTKDVRWAYMLAATIGLGLSNHALFRLACAVFVLPLVIHRKRLPKGFVPGFIGLCLFALLAYLYLPAASLGKPVHNWGDPSNFRRFLAHVNASEIREAFQDNMIPSLFRLGLYFREYIGQLWHCLGFLLVLGVLSLIYSLATFPGQKSKHNLTSLGAMAALLVGAETVYAIAINPMGIRDLQNGQFSILLLGESGGICCVVLAKQAILAAPRLRTLAGAMGGIVILGSLLPSIPHGFHTIHQDWTAEDLAVVHTSFAKPHAMTTLVSDSMIAAHLYAQIALDARPDMAIFGRNQIANGERFAYVARRQPYPIVDETSLNKWANTTGLISADSFAARMHEIVSKHQSTRAIYWEENVLHRDLSSDYKTTLEWPVGRVLNQEGTKKETLCGEAETSLCSTNADALFVGNEKSKLTASKYYREWLAERWALMGKRLVASGAFEKAGKMFIEAIKLAPEVAAWKTNLAVCLASTGQTRKALEWILVAVDLNPLSRVAVRNGILYAREVGDNDVLKILEEHARKLK